MYKKAVPSRVVRRSPESVGKSKWQGSPAKEAAGQKRKGPASAALPVREAPALPPHTLAIRSGLPGRPSVLITV